MSVMRRIGDITRATLNDQLERAEDPVAVIDRYLTQQAEHIRHLEELLRQCVQHTQLMKQQAVAAEQMKAKREQQAMLAMRAGEEHLARIALQEKLLQEEKHAQYQDLYEQGTLQTGELEQELANLKVDYNEVLGKRQYYIARLESVRLKRRMNEQMGRTSGPSGSRLFDRLEERVSDLELEARSLAEIRRFGQEALYEAGAKVNSVLERELSLLKAKLEREGSRLS